MSPSVTTAKTPAGGPPGRSALDKVMSGIERAGNKLPHPVLLFLGLFLIIGTVSTVFAATGTTVTVPGEDETLAVKGLFTGEGVRWLLENFIPNFTGFPSLGTVLLMMAAVGVAEKTGLLETAVRASIARAPRRLLPYLVAFVACQAHLMSDVAILVIPPLAALAFKNAGRNPIAGLIGGFACTCAGYAAGFSIGALDALYTGITHQAAAVVPGGESAPTHILINYFYTAAASCVLALIGGFLISRVLEPRLPQPDPAAESEAEAAEESGAEPGASAGAATARPSVTVTARQRTGLLRSGLAVLLYAAVVVTCWLLPGSPLRGEGGALVPSPVLDGIVPLLFVAFVLAGVVYGRTVGTLTRAEDAPRMMAESITGMSGYIVLILVISQVIGVFDWSNVGTLLAVNGANLLESAGLTGFTGLVLFVLLVCVLNLFVTSGSALWSLVAPVFVPAFLLLGMEPAVTQAAFRIGDSATQMITPLNPYVFLMLTILRRYEPSAQLGTVLSRLSVFVVPFLIAWLAVLGLFYGLGLPLGPGADIHR
ncbi:p-aminobenzoyl-glutamate transporter [Streptomyces longisporoflavus]|uniref:AbgT family transporter n=1 Tax=Streptomyces longisporoflavus TaxID=28044 RepID=UPI00167D8F45|nr:AbgT family transporter [Streptomyces longisporoflavus]GGV25607.1 p-aminobenzoyl-glutamate transporter [Streptomyces longisporoflavus]